MRIAPRNTVSARARWLPLAIALLAFLLRVVTLLELRATPLWDSLGLDAAYYLATARRIAAGGWLGDEVFFMGPLYPYALALIGSLTGFSLEAIRLAQAALGSLATLLLFEIGRRVTDLRTAAIAAVGLAIYPMALYYDNHLLMTGLVLALVLVVLLDLLRLGENPRSWRLALSGALLGVAAMARASILLVVPGILVWLWVGAPEAAAGRDARDDVGARRHRIRRLLAYASGLAAVLALTTVRNLAVGGDPVMLTSNGGLNLYIGNNPIGRGTYLPLDGVARAAGVPASVDISWMIEDPTGRTIAEAAAGRPLRPSEVSGFYVRRTLDYVSEQPGRALAILGRKLLLFWNAAEIAQIEDPELYRELLPILRWPLPGFGLIAPLALAGMVVGWRQRRRLLLLYLFVPLYTLSIALFFVTSRYRAPVVPVLLLFAAIAVGWLVDTARRAWRDAPAGRAGARRQLGAALVGLVAATLVVHLDLVRIDRAAAQINLGIAYIEDGQSAEAIAAFERAVEFEPGDVTARYNLAAAHLKAGDPAAARDAFRDALRLEPRSVVALTGLARAEAMLGHGDQAILALREATRLAPARGALWYELGELELRSGRRDSAIAALERATRLMPGAFPAWNTLARLHAEAGDYRSALEAARQATAGQPLNPHIHSQLGMLEAMHGESERAEAALRRALELEPRLVPARLGLARLFHEQGRADSARVHLAIAGQQAPDDPQVAALAREIDGP